MVNIINLEKNIVGTLESLRKQNYSPETIRRYSYKYNVLFSLAKNNTIEDNEHLFKLYLSNNKNIYTGNFSVLKNRQRIRAINLLKSFIETGTALTSRKNGKSVSDRIRTFQFIEIHKDFVTKLKLEKYSPNTICTYNRIVAYFLIYLEQISVQRIADIKKR